MCKLTAITTHQKPATAKKSPDGESESQPEISDSAPVPIISNIPAVKSNGDFVVLRVISTDEDEVATTNAGKNTSKGKNIAFLPPLSSTQQFLLLSSTMFVFFGLHNILQEAMMKVPGFHGVMLAYMEVLG